MTDTGQILLVVAICITTVLLTIVGIQLILILKDVRRIASRVDALTASFERLGFSFSSSYGEVLGFISGIKKIINVVEDVSDRKKSKE